MFGSFMGRTSMAAAVKAAGGGGGGGLANIVRHYAADGLLYIDTPPTIIASNLDPVKYWDDASGNGNGIDSRAKDPVFNSATPSLNFAGGKCLVGTQPSVFNGGSTVILVFKPGADGYYPFNESNLAGNSDLYDITFPASGLMAWNVKATVGGNSTVNFADNAIVNGVPCIRVLTYTGAVTKTSRSFGFAGGVLNESSTGAFVHTTAPANIDTVSVGAISIFSTHYTGFNGEMYEIIQTSDVASDEDIESQCATLAAKWGIA